jgi:hypothetical protein
MISIAIYKVFATKKEKTINSTVPVVSLPIADFWPYIETKPEAFYYGVFGCNDKTG